MADPRDHSKTIPSSFIALDDHTDAADQCVSVYDEQKFWLNHNFACAKNIRRIILAQSWQSPDGTFTLPSVGETFYSMSDPSRGGQFTILMSEEILLSQFCDQVQMYIQGTALHHASTANPVLYPTITRVEQLPQPDPNTTINLDQGSTITSYSATINVPTGHSHESADGFRWFRFSIILGSVLDTNQSTTNQTITDVGPNWYQTSSAAPTANQDAVYWDTNPTVGNRMVAYTETVGTDERVYVDRPWATVPNIGDTAVFQKSVGIKMRHLTLYELETSDFDLKDEIAFS